MFYLTDTRQTYFQHISNASERLATTPNPCKGEYGRHVFTTYSAVFRSSPRANKVNIFGAGDGGVVTAVTLTRKTLCRALGFGASCNPIDRHDPVPRLFHKCTNDIIIQKRKLRHGVLKDESHFSIYRSQPHVRDTRME